MELTRRQLKEDFKPYRVSRDRPYYWRRGDRLIERLNYLYKEQRPWVDKLIIINELISRGCSRDFTIKEGWTPYDLDEAKPYRDSSNFMVNRVINEINGIPEIYKDNYFE